MSEQRAPVSGGGRDESSGGPMIEVSNVSKIYDTADGEVRALDDVSLTVDQGEVLGVVGTSGAGKSTLIRVINLLERPTSGKVVVDGQELTALGTNELRRARQQIGMIFQHFNLLDSRTAADNIAFPLELAGVDRQARRKRAAELLEFVDLGDRGQAYPNQLSGGQKQRVAIARALASDTKVLLCDEATSALDPDTTRAILDLLKRLNREFNLTIVLITHSMPVVTAICDTTALIQGGRIVEHGAVTDIARRPGSVLAKELLPPLPAVPSDSEKGSVVDITVAGGATQTPVFASLVREFDLDINILGGAVTEIAGERFGHFRIHIPGGGEQRQQVIEFLRKRDTNPVVAA